MIALFFILHFIFRRGDASLGEIGSQGRQAALIQVMVFLEEKNSNAKEVLLESVKKEDMINMDVIMEDEDAAVESRKNTAVESVKK